jgi:hypothetical protein
MLTAEQLEKRRKYMREYTRRNANKINAARRLRAQAPDAKAKKAAQDKTYRERTADKRQTPEFKQRAAEKSRAWAAANPGKVREQKRACYATEAGKAQKRKEEAAYVASGGRAKQEAKRAAKPLSDARKAARAKWARNNQTYFTASRAYRRTLEKALDPFEFWVLREAVSLARLREIVVGGHWHVDHIVPVSKGGDSRPDNLQVVPATWNRRKSNRHAERFLGA